MIFVTGGTGFLGRFLIPALCRAGYALKVLTRTPEQHTWLEMYPGITIVKGDLQDKDAVFAAMAGCDRVIHAASLFSMWQYAGDFSQNVTGTVHILDAAIHHNIKKLVYVSTAAVVGTPIPGQIVDEQHPVAPADPYQQSKLDSENLVLEYFKKINFPGVVIRPGAFYGPMGDYAFNRLFFKDPRRGIIMQMDGGRYTIFPVYVGDVASGIVLALENGQPGEIYNICGECLTHRAAFDIICEQANLRWLPRLNLPDWLGINFSRLLTWLSLVTRREPFYPVGLRSYVFNNWHVSSEKAKHDLGFVPIPFEEGVRRTLEWYQLKQPDMLAELECDTPLNET
ncbi:MAG: NAD-dependent epimerase/dehydratase family protein [Aggregatilineales bacterium]